MQFKDDLGFVTMVQNTDINYLELAYLQALSIKLTMPGSKYAVIADNSTLDQYQSYYWDAIDYVVPIPNDCAKHDQQKFANEWQTFYLTPFRETIKLESDLIFTRDISHWLHAFRFKDVVLSTGVKNYKQKESRSRVYRHFFDVNELPDVYNGLMYFRTDSDFAHKFFNLARMIFLYWEDIKYTLKRAVNVTASTDVVYGLVAKILGVENCTLPLDWINFVHMKPAINNWPNVPWHKAVITEIDVPMIRIGNLNQYHPIHYYEKTWVTKDLIKEYQNGLLGRTTKSI